MNQQAALMAAKCCCDPVEGCFYRLNLCPSGASDYYLSCDDADSAWLLNGEDESFVFVIPGPDQNGLCVFLPPKASATQLSEIPSGGEMVSLGPQAQACEVCEPGICCRDNGECVVTLRSQCDGKWFGRLIRRGDPFTDEPLTCETIDCEDPPLSCCVCTAERDEEDPFGSPGDADISCTTQCIVYVLSDAPAKFCETDNGCNDPPAWSCNATDNLSGCLDFGESGSCHCGSDLNGCGCCNSGTVTVSVISNPFEACNHTDVEGPCPSFTPT